MQSLNPLRPQEPPCPSFTRPLTPLREGLGRAPPRRPRRPPPHPSPGRLTHVGEAPGLPAVAGWAHAVTTPDHDLLIPVAGLDVLRELTPNMAAVGGVPA